MSLIPKPNRETGHQVLPFVDFSRGISTGVVGPEGSLLQARNIILYDIGYGPRKGSYCWNMSYPLIIGTGRVLAIREHIHRDHEDNSLTHFFIAVVDNSGVYEVYLLNRSGNTFVITSKSILHEEWPLASSRVYWASGRPRFESVGNRLFHVNGSVYWDVDSQGAAPGTYAQKGDNTWTDGTDHYRNGIDQPGVLGEGIKMKVEAVATGGSMSDGIYYIAIQYRRANNWATESPAYYTMVDALDADITYVGITLSAGTAVQRIKVTLTWTAVGNMDGQVDQIWCFRTLAGATTVFYRDSDSTVDNISPDMDPAKEFYFENTDATLLEAYKVLETDFIRPYPAVDLTYCAGRMYYAGNDRLWVSLPDKPEKISLGVEIFIGQDNGQTIRVCQVVRDNFILVVLTRSTYILDGSDPLRIRPVVKDVFVGIAEANTFVIIPTVGIAVWFSQQRDFVACDLSEVVSLTRRDDIDSIFSDIEENVDMSRISEACAIYHPERISYLCSLPYQGGGTRVWEYLFVKKAWVKHDYPFKATYLFAARDENNVEYVFAAATMTGMASTVEDDYGYLVQLDINPGDEHKDISYPSDVGASVQYTNLTTTGITPFVTLGEPDRSKEVKQISVLWGAESAVSGWLSLGFDYGYSTLTPEAYVVAHDGQVDGDGNTVTHTAGDDDIYGWDIMRAQHYITDVDCQGFQRSLSLKFEVSASTVKYRIYGFFVYYKEYLGGQL
jgi:hypothetical protein